MRKIIKAHKRARGGLKLFMLKYWGSFCSGSFVIHILSLLVVSALALQFVQSLSRPAAPGPDVMYVQLIYPEPLPLAKPDELTPSAKTGTNRTPATDIVSKRKPAQKMAATESERSSARKKPVYRARRLAKVRRARKRVPPPNLASEILADNTPAAADETAGGRTPSGEDADGLDGTSQAPPVADDIEEDVITIIRGTQKTKLAQLDLPQKDPSTPPGFIAQEPEEEASGPDRDDYPDDTGKEIGGGKLQAEDDRDSSNEVPGSELFSNLTTLHEPGGLGLPYYVLSAPVPLENFTVSLGLPVLVSYAPEAAALSDALLYKVPPELASVNRQSASVFTPSADTSMTNAAAQVRTYPLREMALENRPLAMAAFSLHPAGFDPAVRQPELFAEKRSSLPPVPLPGSGRAAQSRDAVVSRHKLILFEDIFEEPDEAPFVDILEPGPGETDRSIVEVSGVVSGIGVESVDLSVKGDNKRLFVKDGGFRSTVVLEEGRNAISATAIDAAGRVTRSRVVVSYVPSRTGPAVELTNPLDGQTIDALRKKEVEINGTVEGEGVDAVRIYLNNTVLDARLSDGRFSVRAPLLSESNRLYAEATNAYGMSGKTGEITFNVVNLHPRDVSISMESSSREMKASLSCSWKVHPLAEKLDIPYGPGNAPMFETASFPGSATAFTAGLVPGIYTVALDYDTKGAGTATVSFRVTIYGYDKEKKKTRTAGPFKLSGRGRVKAVRVMLPEMVFWEDDSYFSGFVEGPGYTMKYKEPGGISWKEED